MRTPPGCVRRLMNPLPKPPASLASRSPVPLPKPPSLPIQADASMLGQEVGLAGGQFAKLGHGLVLVGRAHTSRVRSAPWHADDLAGVGLTAESMIPAQARAGSGDGR